MNRPRNTPEKIIKINKLPRELDGKYYDSENNEIKIKNIFKFSYAIINNEIKFFDKIGNDYEDYKTENIIVCGHVVNNYQVHANGELWSKTTKKPMKMSKANNWCAMDGYNITNGYIPLNYFYSDNIYRVISEIEGIPYKVPDNILPKKFSYSDHNIKYCHYTPNYLLTGYELEEYIENQLNEKKEKYKNKLSSDVFE